MTEALRDQVRHWFDVYKGRLYLDGWDVDLVFNDDPAWGKFGQCERDAHGERAKVTLSLAFSDADQGKLAAIHELLHMTFDPLDDLLGDWRTMIGEDSWPLFERQAKRAMETVICRLERCLADWEVE